MDFSAANTGLWSPIIQFGLIAGLIIVANILRRKIPFIRKSLMPTAVLAGFIMLILKYVGVINFVEISFLDAITYHALGIGFIAMTLRTPTKESGSSALIGSKSGALIVSTYLVQALTGLAISLFLAYTIKPDFFKAAGILLPMGYGQGPGQANNIGAMYEGMGMTGGQSFGLSIAAAGFLCACVVGVIFMNIYSRKGKLKIVGDQKIVSGSVTVETFQDENEIPIAESVDKLSVQVALVLALYLITYLLTWGITSLLAAISPGLANAVSGILWGFNFIVGSVVALAARAIIKGLRSAKIMNRQYQNNYLLDRVSGMAFDFMIVAGIACIDINDLKGNWLPFILMAIAGGAVTFLYLRHMCKKLYPEYEEEGFFSMYGMLTGTVSSGVLLLREIDPNYKTPAANNLLTGSSFGIIFGAPLLILISMAGKSDVMTWVVTGLIVIYLALLLLFINKVGSKKAKKNEK